MKSKDSISKKSVWYQKKDGRSHALPSFFWYDNDEDLKVCFLVTHINRVAWLCLSVIDLLSHEFISHKSLQYWQILVVCFWQSSVLLLLPTQINVAGWISDKSWKITTVFWLKVLQSNLVHNKPVFLAKLRFTASFVDYKNVDGCIL